MIFYALSWSYEIAAYCQSKISTSNRAYLAGIIGLGGYSNSDDNVYLDFTDSNYANGTAKVYGLI